MDCVVHVLDQVDAHLRGQADFLAFTNSIMYADVGSILNQSERNPLVPVNEFCTLQTIVPLLTKGVHRVPTFNDNKSLVGVLSQSDFILLLAANRSDPQMSTILQKTVQELGYKQSLLTAGCRTLVYDILSEMKNQKIAAVPLVNEKAELVGCFSASDLKLLNLKEWPHLFQDVNSFLRERHPESLRPVSVTNNGTFGEVLEKMEQHKIHRVFVIDDTQKPIGIITMTNVLLWLNNILVKSIE